MRRAAPSKYRAKPTTVDGIRFHSQKEAVRYAELKMLLKAGEISCLRLQPAYDLKVGEQKVGKYIGDFAYRDGRTQKWIVEDVKGFRTRVYRLKAKLMRAIHGIEIQEI